MTKYPNETYNCPNNCELSDIDILNNWLCPICHEKLTISLGNNIFIQRKKVEQLTENDWLYFIDGNFYEVISVATAYGKNHKNELYIALRNYGHIYLKANDYIECLAR